MNRRLYRSETDRQIAGVCGGIADYFNIDPTIVRLIFLVLFFAGGPGLILYVALWIVMPEESDVIVQEEVRKAKRNVIDADN